MFNDFGKIVTRTPLLPYNTLFDNHGKTKDLRELAHELLEHKAFMEGIFWSSISLYERLTAYVNGKKLSDKKEKRLFSTLGKYIIRASTRSTPFGTFAGIGVQNLHAETFHRPSSQRHLRIDIRILKRLIRSIENNEALSGYITYHVNNTLYSLYDQFRFLEINKKDEHKIQISSLEKTEVLNKIVSLDHKQGFQFKEFHQLFSDAFTQEELAEFFRELIDTGFLVSDLEVRLTDEEPFNRIIGFLRQPNVYRTKATSKYLKLIAKINGYIKITAEKPLGDFGEEAYKKLLGNFNDTGIPIGNEPLFHVDLTYKPEAPLKISNRDFKNITEAIDVLGKLVTPKKVTSNFQLRSFKQLFNEKYETKAIPLLEVLDPDIGIGFPAAESIGNNNSGFFEVENEESGNSEAKHNVSEWLIDKIENLPIGCNKIRVLTNELKHIENKNHGLANSFYVMGQLVSEGNILLQDVGGVAANTLLSRFAYMNPEINALCKAITNFEKEVSKEAVFADILWSPRYKVANISRRIIHTDYEIPIYYPSSKDKNHTIPLNDLMVSVEKNQIVLTSKSLEKRIIPRLSNAHNFHRSRNPLYKFLSSLQYQGLSGFALKPDFTANKKRTFPRIFYKNIILFPAHWIFQESDIQKIKTAEHPLTALNDFFNKWKVCRYVSLTQGDNELFIDIQNKSYLELLLGELNKQKTLILKEWLYDPKDKLIRYTNQFILPLKKIQPLEFKKSAASLRQKDSLSFFPGSDWVYFKIYCSTNFSDFILKQLETDFIAPLIQKKFVEKWFFIRYADPHHHIRLRLHKSIGFSTGKLTDLLKKNLNSFIEKGIVWKVRLDTYKREIERYGEFEMINSEKLFHIDSQFCVDCLKETNMQEDTVLRLLLAVKNVDYWLTGYNFDTKQKKEYCETMEASLKKEKTIEFLTEVKNKYRKYKINLNDFMNGENLNLLFENRRDLMKGLPLKNKNLPSHIHMNLNRWFGSQQRDWEYLVYYFCAAYYRTQTFIGNKK